MNRLYLILSIILIVFVASITYLGLIPAYLALISIILGLSPLVYDSLFRSKAVISINNVRFEKKVFDHVTGYQLKTEVSNKGQRVSDLIAAIAIRDANGKQPNLTRVDVREERGRQEVRSKEEGEENIDYAWIDMEGNAKIRVLEFLENGKTVNLTFPHEAFKVGGGDRWFSYRILLSLERNSTYDVQIEIQGRDEKKTRFNRKKEVTLIPN
jgi:hypothetical protein